ncbi:LTXXQ domain protein [Pseudomonas sp. 148P]|uniref:LTXXQ domain protein n=1 Tax=Pseudomonas ulcerans TaxID=3115852 RepID=A0ABU7HTU9_9PSED|nr:MULTISPECIES: LTXXQ domain protein [unclassified Pseudomonas]MEE1923856.1 LTXXQ domain protein [Pseudomonas sp. 147P]MEE1934934.1 LTXXQ domain protein [Pseudomonas sp. 148P]
MRKTLIALMLAAALPTVAMAMPENGPGPGPDHGPRFEHHRGDAPFAKLDLTREQRQQIGKLMGQEMKDRREVTQRFLDKLPPAEQKAMKDELKAKQDKTQADIRALLKPEQQKQFDEMKKKREERRAEWQEFQAWKAEHGKKAQ